MNRRITTPKQTACYHCMSRTVHGERWLDTHEKATLRSLLWRAAAFSGVRLLTYCIMSNHFHLLIEVPPKAQREGLTNAELARRYRVLHGDKPAQRYSQLSAYQVDAIFEGGGYPAVELRERLLERMHDLSQFMETVKSRFTRWYNHKHETFGTLWASRFKSVLLEGTATTLRDVATYIDLNPVRAGMVEDPAEYPFSGLGEARFGYGPAKAGLEVLMDYGNAPGKDAYARYRLILYGRGRASSGLGKTGCIPKEVADRVIQSIPPTGTESTTIASPKFSAKAMCNAFVLGSHSFLEANLDWLATFLRRKKPLKLLTSKDDCADGAYLNQKA